MGGSQTLPEVLIITMSPSRRYRPRSDGSPQPQTGQNDSTAMPPAQDGFSHVLYHTVLPFPRGVLIAASSHCTYYRVTTSLCSEHRQGCQEAQTHSNTANPLGDLEEVWALVLHALNALFLAEHLSEATPLHKRLSSTPKCVLTLQRNELLNRWCGWEMSRALFTFENRK